MWRAMLGVGIVALVALIGVDSSSAANPLEPELGLYEGTTSAPSNGDVAIPPFTVKVVKVGALLGADFAVWIPVTCVFANGEKGPQSFIPWKVRGSEKPLPIKNGRFSKQRSTNGSSGPEKYVINAAFKSSTKIVGSVSVKAKYQTAPGFEGPISCGGVAVFTVRHK